MSIQLDHTFAKINKDGVRVLSNTLSKGEKLATGETYAQVVKRMGGETIGIPPEKVEPSPVVGQAMTLEPTGVSTVLARDVEDAQRVIDRSIEATLAGETPAAKEDNSKTETTVATVDEEGSSTAVEHKPATRAAAKKTSSKK